MGNASIWFQGGSRAPIWEEFLRVLSPLRDCKEQRWSLLTWGFQVAVALLSCSATGISLEYSAIHRIPASSQLSSRSSLPTILSCRSLTLVLRRTISNCPRYTLFTVSFLYIYLLPMTSSWHFSILLQLEALFVSSEADHYLVAQSLHFNFQ